MTNLLAVLPDLDLSPFSHILPSLERALLTTADLLILDAPHVAKRAHVPPGEVKKLTNAVLDALRRTPSVGKEPLQSADHGHPKTDSVWLGFDTVSQLVRKCIAISTLDDALDMALGGGIAPGHLTEIAGESAAGKTQFLLTLLLVAQLPESQNGLSDSPQRNSALYISTEAPLQTTRLVQILRTHPRLAALDPVQRPSLHRVHSTHIHDLEAQEHIIRFQLPVAIRKHNVRLVVIDSIAANYRAEFDKGSHSGKTHALAKRNTQLAQLGAFLQNLARKHNIAVVVANQVADRFAVVEPTFYPHSPATQPTRSVSPAITANMSSSATAQALNVPVLSTDDPLAIHHQQRFFTGWGDDATTTNLKTPSLGLIWTNQLATRIVLLKEPIYEEKIYSVGDERNLIGWKRTFKVVFSASSAESMIDFEIWEGGIRSTSRQQHASPK